MSINRDLADGKVIADNVVTSAKIVDATIQPGDLTQKMTLMTAVTASGTSIDFTGIPSWAKRITVMFNGVSTSGTSTPLIQLGTSGGIDNATYLAGSGIIGTSSAAGATYTTGFGIGSVLATASDSGSAVISNVSGNIWACNGVVSFGTIAGAAMFGGSKTLSATLDRIRITTVNGTDLFDAGSINIMYEG